MDCLLCLPPNTAQGRVYAHAHTHSASICVRTLTSRHTHGSQPPCVHIPHTQPHIPLSASLAPALGFSGALLRAPRAAMKCESPPWASEPPWAREGSRGTHTFFRPPCLALKLTITLGGQVGIFFFKGLSHYISSKKGKPFVSGSTEFLEPMLKLRPIWREIKNGRGRRPLIFAASGGIRN